EWAKIGALHLVVSIDGLHPDHDVRRAPATYERILRNIEGHSITVHCTITHQMASKDAAGARYFEEFLSFWSARPEVNKIWFSIFTPQVGEEATEILPPDEREPSWKRLRVFARYFRSCICRTSCSKAIAAPRNPPKSVSSRARRSPSPPTWRAESLPASSAATPIARSAAVLLQPC